MEEGLPGNELYIVQEGTCSVFKRGYKIAEKTIGSTIGELELLYDSPSYASVSVSSASCLIWVIARESYLMILIASSIKTRAEYEIYLAKVQFLQTLSPSEKLQLSDALTSLEYEPGEYIIHHGDEGQWMFLVMEGVVEVLGRNNVDEISKVCEFTEGDHFGELEFLNNHKCVADVVARTHVRTARINRSHFELCLGPVIHVLKRDASDPKYEYYKKQLEMGTANQQSRKWGMPS